MASCWGWRSEETGWLVSNDLVITRQEGKGEEKQQEPPDFEFHSAAAISAITQFSPVLKVSFYSLHYMSKFLNSERKRLHIYNNRMTVFKCTYVPIRKQKSRKPQEGWLTNSEFSPCFLNNFSQTNKQKTPISKLYKLIKNNFRPRSLQVYNFNSNVLHFFES